MVKFFKEKVKPIFLILDAVLCGIMLGIMDFSLFPKIEASTLPIKAFDLQPFGYTYDTALAFIKRLSENGKSIYLSLQLPLDFIFPILYTFLFIALFIKLRDKGHKFIIFPLGLFLCDYAENVCTALMLKSGASFSSALAVFGGTASALKSVLMYICGILVIVFLILYLKRKRSVK